MNKPAIKIGALVAAVGGAFVLARAASKSAAVSFKGYVLPDWVDSEHELPGIVLQAFGELARWTGLTETTPQGEALVREYWAGAGQSYPGISEPWSAVFVSDMANKGDPGSLKPAQSHFAYASQAYQDRGKAGRYGAYRPEELAVKAGDIVIRSRSGSAARFEDLAHAGSYKPSHGDILAVVGPRSATGIGGNVNNRVDTKAIPLTASGHVDTSADPLVFAVLRKQA